MIFGSICYCKGKHDMVCFKIIVCSLQSLTACLQTLDYVKSKASMGKVFKYHGFKSQFI